MTERVLSRGNPSCAEGLWAVERRRGKGGEGEWKRGEGERKRGEVEWKRGEGEWKGDGQVEGGRREKRWLKDTVTRVKCTSSSHTNSTQDRVEM